MSKDRLERLIGRAKRRDLFDEEGEQQWRRPTPTEKNAVKRDSWDKRAWDYAYDQMQFLHEQVDELAEDFPTSPAAYEDLFNLLNQGDPRMVDPGDIDPLYRPQALIAHAMREAEDLKFVRKHTRFDDHNTAIAMMTMKDRMRKAFEDLKDALDAIEQAQQALAQALQEAQERMEGEGQPGEGAGNPDGTAVNQSDGGEGQGRPTDEELADQLERALKAMAEAEAQGEKAAEQAERDAKAGVREAGGELQRQADAARAYGLEDGDLKRMSFEERQRLAGKLDGHKMKRFADLVGQFAIHQDAEVRRKVQHAPSEIFDVETGDDLRNLVSTEYNNLAIPETEDLFWLRYAKRTLLQWERKGPEHAGRGPILVVCDESGSMGCPLDEHGNTREAWSKAVSLALASQAKRGKRDFTYIGFSSAGQVWETTFEKGGAELDQIVGFVEHFYGGGTAYERPLLRAMQIVQEYAARGMTRPDIVFITDDDCHVGDEFIEKWRQDCKEADVQCYGVRVGSRADDGWRSSMASLCDRVINVNNLTAKPEDVNDLWRLI